MTSKRVRNLFLSMAWLAGLIAGPGPATAAGDDSGPLLQVLPKSRLTLADGLRQAAKGGEVPISAKFELDDHQQLSLSVYTAEKGLAVDAEHNVLKELSGSPEKTPWMTEVEVFKDIPHVARASEHLTLTAVARQSLLDVVGRAQKEHSGTVFSIAPAIHEKRAVFVVLLADKGKVVERKYDAATGQLLGPKR